MAGERVHEPSMASSSMMDGSGVVPHSSQGSNEALRESLLQQRAAVLSTLNRGPLPDARSPRSPSRPLEPRVPEVPFTAHSNQLANMPPGNHLLVPHHQAMIMQQINDERSGYWLEGYHAGWREAHDVSIVLPDDNSEAIAVLSKSVANIDSKVCGLEGAMHRAMSTLNDRQTADRARTTAAVQESIGALGQQVSTH